MNPKLANYLTPVVALFFATALGVTASSTIGTDISTGGNLDVTGNTTLTGTLDVTGVTTLGDLSVVGNLTASTTAAGSDVILRAMDDILLYPSDGLTVSTDGDFLLESDGVGADTHYSYLDMGSGYADFQVSDGSANGGLEIGPGAAYLLGGGASGRVGIDISGGTDEFFVNISRATAMVPLGIPSLATLPACSTTIAPTGSVALAWDTTGADLCVCNGTSWAPVDGVGTCE